MKIGFDGKRAANNITGLGNYSRSLIAHIAAQFPENQYVIYTPKIKAEIEKLALFKKPNIRLELPTEGKSKLFWRSFGIKNQLKKDEIDLFHGLSQEIPLGIYKTGIKSLVTIHDLIFLRKPQYYQLIDRFIYKFKSKYACSNADGIIAISQKTKEDIVEFYHINPSKIEVIYQSCDDGFKTLASAAEQEKISKKYNLPPKFILNVGSIEARKNLLLVIKALPKLDKTYHLVVIGKETTYTVLVKKEIEKLGLQHWVIFLQKIPFSDLPIIYQLATVFVYPSFYEGFGIPIIEALYSNTPVIAATGSCLEEAGGPNSIYVSPDDEDEMASAINLVLADVKLQEMMKKAGLQYVQKFNSDVVNRQLSAYYLKTLTHI